MDDLLGRPVAEVYARCPELKQKQLIITAAHGKFAGERQCATLRVVAVRPDVLVAARFLDGQPPQEEEKTPDV